MMCGWMSMIRRVTGLLVSRDSPGLLISRDSPGLLISGRSCQKLLAAAGEYHVLRVGVIAAVTRAARLDGDDVADLHRVALPPQAHQLRCATHLKSPVVHRTLVVLHVHEEPDVRI